MGKLAGYRDNRAGLIAAAMLTVGILAFGPHGAAAVVDLDEAAALEMVEQELQGGSVDYNEGRFVDALEHFDAALGRSQKYALDELTADALAGRAETYKALGFHGKALGDLEIALGLAERQDKTSVLAKIHGIMGDTYRRIGEPEKATEQLKLCVALARQSGEQRTLAVAMNDLANLMMTTDRGGEALATYQAAITVAEDAGEAGLVATTTVNAARLHWESGNKQASASLMHAAFQKLAALPAGHQKAYGLIAIGSLARELWEAEARKDGRYLRLAHGAYSQAAGSAEETGDLRSLSYALGFLGQLYERTGRRQEAEQLTQRARFAAETLDAPEITYLWQWQSGRLLRSAGRTEDAIGSYQNAVASLQKVRQDFLVGFRGGRSPFRKAVEPVFLELADLLLESASQDVAGNANVKLVAARETIEQLKAAELQDYFQDDCVAALQAKVKPIDELAERTAAIYPILLSDRLELLVTLPSGLRQVTVEVPSAAVTEQIRSYRILLEKRTTRQYLRPARQLYDWLIRPIEPLLVAENIDTLVFIPDGPLRTVPMAALHDGEEHLISRYAVAVAPGLSLIDPKPTAQEGLSILLAGLTEAKPGFAALPNVEAELSMAAEIFGGGMVLKDEAFLLGAFKKNMSERPYTVVHIASHGQFEAEAAKSFLLAYDGKLTLDGLEDVLKLSRFREEPVELLTLSACRTAAGDDRAALGLAGVAIKAGARSALASLWFINDRASTDLVTEFYRELNKPCATKAKALQNAQLKILSDTPYRHPGYWAPFLLIGNWL